METLREGSKGPDVGALHQALVETGLQVDVLELDRTEFGPSTKEAVEDFQARHQDGAGRALKIDGEVGTLTWAAISGGAQPPGKWTAPGWRCDLSEVSETVRRVLQVARDELGAREQPPGSNRGPKVDQYTNWVGVPPNKPGPPWCMAFISWCWSHADGGSPFGRILSVYKMVEWGRDKKRVVTVPQLGDVGCILRSRFHGHGFLVCGVAGDVVMSVEGNSGQAVRGLVRSVASITAVVRPSGDL